MNNKNAKEDAKLLVDAWNEGKIGTRNQVIEMYPYIRIQNLESSSKASYIDTEMRMKGSLRTLSNKGLVDHYTEKGIDYLLLSEDLCVAVANDFRQSDVPISGFNINGNVGSINSNNTITNQQNVGTNYGEVNMTSQEIADELERITGEEYLNTYTELRDAIVELRQSKPEEKQSRVKKVVSVVGGIIAVTADISTVVLTVLTFLAPLML